MVLGTSLQSLIMERFRDFDQLILLMAFL